MISIFIGQMEAHSNEENDTCCDVCKESQDPLIQRFRSALCTQAQRNSDVDMREYLQSYLDQKRRGVGWESGKWWGIAFVQFQKTEQKYVFLAPRNKIMIKLILLYVALRKISKLCWSDNLYRALPGSFSFSFSFSFSLR